MISDLFQTFLQSIPALSHYSQLRGLANLDVEQTAYVAFIEEQLEGVALKVSYLTLQTFMPEDLYNKRVREVPPLLRRLGRKDWDSIVRMAEAHSTYVDYAEKVKEIAREVFAKQPIARWLFTSHPDDSPQWECPGWFNIVHNCRKKAIAEIRKHITEAVVPDFLSPEMIQQLAPLWEGIEENLRKKFKKEKKYHHLPSMLSFGPHYQQAATVLGLQLEVVRALPQAEAYKQIGAAYRAIVLTCHPDLFPPQSEAQRVAHDRTVMVNTARSLLLSGI